MRIEEAAVMAARIRFRPILMTSFAFILGVVPLVLGTGAGANAQKSIGIAVLTGMLGSTLLTVAFVPSVFVVLQRFEEWRARRKAAAPQPFRRLRRTSLRYCEINVARSEEIAPGDRRHLRRNADTKYCHVRRITTRPTACCGTTTQQACFNGRELVGVT